MCIQSKILYSIYDPKMSKEDNSYVNTVTILINRKDLTNNGLISLINFFSIMVDLYFKRYLL